MGYLQNLLGYLNKTCFLWWSNFLFCFSLQSWLTFTMPMIVHSSKKIKIKKRLDLACKINIFIRQNLAQIDISWSWILPAASKSTYWAWISGLILISLFPIRTPDLHWCQVVENQIKVSILKEPYCVPGSLATFQIHYVEFIWAWKPLY